ncbi:DUF6879 family protein [Streptomyces sp. NPDC008079]|uniref:DUF6879 family protein n=1 Tax=Streptomyces sp. NPDC008079 TaxID=3364806 RepID=UPI0036DFB9C7
MPDLVPFSDIAHLFTDFEQTARRLESRRGYAVDIGTPKWELWKVGGDLGYNPGHPWHANVRAQTGQGKRFERVRTVDSPPTEGQRFLMASGRGNVEAGEEIRHLPRAAADRMGLPAEDFWLFDNLIVVRIVFDGDDNTLGVEVRDDHATVAAARRIWAAAWSGAINSAEFAARVPSSM